MNDKTSGGDENVMRAEDEDTPEGDVGTRDSNEEWTDQAKSMLRQDLHDKEARVSEQREATKDQLTGVVDAEAQHAAEKDVQRGEADKVNARADADADEAEADADDAEARGGAAGEDRTGAHRKGKDQRK